MPQPSAPRRSATTEPSASVCAFPSRSAMPQLSASSPSATPQSSACAAPRRSAIPQPYAPRRSATPQPSACAAPRQSAIPKASASASAGTVPHLSAMPQSSGPRRSATPKPSASVCAAPRRSAISRSSASSPAMAQSASACRLSAFTESVLLDKVVYLGGFCDETTARAKTSDGDPIEVSFLLADPPALTRCFIYCPVMTVDDFFEAAPEIMAADGAFLLIRVIFPVRKLDLRFDVADFFVYRSGPGTPSLELLSLPPLLYPLANLSRDVGVLSCGEHCLVVDLRLDAPDRMGHNLYVFSSKTKSWSTKLARLACGMGRYRAFNFVPDKVFGVEGGSMAWVDLRQGILLCNSVAQDPEMQLIQLPSLTPDNCIRFGETLIGTMPPLNRIRDVSCKDGWFRFIEIEFSHLHDGSTTELSFGWEATMFKRRIHSDKWRCWKPCGTFASAGLSPTNSCLPFYAEKIWDYKKKKLAMNSVISSFPTLDMCHDDVLYMLAKVKDTDPNGWVLSINTKSKKLQKIAPFCANRRLISCIFLQCEFSKHLSGAPGACTANGWKDDIKEDLKPLVPYVTSSLLVQQRLRQLEKYFTHEGVKTLFCTGVSSTMNVHIHQVTQFATKNGLGKAAFDAVNTFERASEDIKNRLSAYRHNGPSTSAKAVKEKIHAAIGALDELLNMLPSSLLDKGRSMVSVGCMDNGSADEGIPAPYLIY